VIEITALPASTRDGHHAWTRPRCTRLGTGERLVNRDATNRAKWRIKWWIRRWTWAWPGSFQPMASPTVW